MTYTFDQFCADSHAAIAKNSGNTGREKIRENLEKLLVNEEFIKENLESQSSGKTLLYHDKDFDFYIMAHGTDARDRTGKPHDHGASWAVYGQAIGLTNMTIWNRIDDGNQIGHAELNAIQTFSLNPGQAALFDTGIIHSTAHPKPARWIRVTGTNLDTIERYSYDVDRQVINRMVPG
ncbi:MAG: hypothetical protein CMM75_05585 [Rhodospirillaceae bacterium]|nr:hypothetical protein [Rhodospirillaceae bacterium]